MSANTKLTYDYLQGGTQDRKLVLGTISCRLYGSNQSFDDRAAKLPLHQIKQSSDTKTGVTTISGFVQSDLTYFEPQVAWEDRTADKSASNWPVDNKGESLCVSIYCDGETKKPVVEYREHRLLRADSEQPQAEATKLVQPSCPMTLMLSMSVSSRAR